MYLTKYKKKLMLNNKISPAIKNEENRLNPVESLIQKISVSKTDKDGQTALHGAAKKGDLEIVKLLLEKMTPEGINQVDQYAMTALLVAATYRKYEIVKLLIESGKCDLSLTDKRINDILTYYPADQRAEIVDLLIKNGAKYPQKEKDDKVSLEILESNQSGHSEEKTPQGLYNKFKEVKEETHLKEELQKDAKTLIKPLEGPEHMGLENQQQIETVENPCSEDIMILMGNVNNNPE
jgi:ankyrin repeat protein